MQSSRKEITESQFLKGLTKEVKRNHPKVRQKSKAYTFGLALTPVA